MAEIVLEPSTTQPIREAYRASWVDVVNGWFDRLPGPIWLGYAVAVAIAIVITGAGATSVAYGPLEWFAVVYYSALPFAVLGLIHDLDRVASRALATVRPLLRMDDVELASVRHRLTVIPARPAWLLAVMGGVSTALGFALDPIGSGVVGLSAAQLGFRWGWESFVTAIFLALLYHTVRQLRLIGRLHESFTTVDVFAQAPLYALSRLTSRTAIGLILLLVPGLLLIPAGADAAFLLITATWYGLVLVMALAAFLVPLRGVHGRLLAEKRRLQTETGQRITTTLAALHAATDTREAAAVEAHAKTLSALTAARDLVNRTPTWPWSAGALTSFISAIALPIVLFLIQRLLSQIV